MNPEELQALIAQGESLAVEFRSDQDPLSDTDLIEAVVCLANGSGGTILIGVENSGRVTGLHSRHRTHPNALAAFVTNRTVPPVNVEAEFVNLPEGPVAVLRVLAAHQPVATSDGRLLIRYTGARGKPRCRPLYPHELPGWRADRGTADVSALPVPGTTWPTWTHWSLRACAGWWKRTAETLSCWNCPTRELPARWAWYVSKMGC